LATLFFILFVCYRVKFDHLRACLWQRHCACFKTQYNKQCSSWWFVFGWRVYFNCHGSIHFSNKANL